jgi:hypothetical protein
MRGSSVSRGRPAALRAVLLSMALVVLGTFGPGPAAEASFDPVGTGSTTIHLAQPFQKLLRDQGVKIQLAGGGRKRGADLILPAAEGEVDPTLRLGTMLSRGTITFVAGKRRLLLRSVTFKSHRTPLYAKVGGGQLKIARAARIRGSRAGFGASFTATGLRLTSKAATRLNKKLGLGQAVAAGQLLGTVKAEEVPLTVHLREQGRVNLELDAAFAKKLNDLFVSVNPIAPAELTPGPVLSLPIGPESTLAPDGSSGTLKLGGAVELLKLGEAQLFWREIWVEEAATAVVGESETLPSPPHPGKQPQGPIVSLLPPAQVLADPGTRTITITGQPLSLTAATAAALNEAFAGSGAPFAAGEAVGLLSLSSQAE